MTSPNTANTSNTTEVKSLENIVTISAHGEWWKASHSQTKLIDKSERFADSLRGVGTLVILSRADSTVCCVREEDGQIAMTTDRMPGPMGLDYRERRLAIGCATDIRSYVDVSPPNSDEALFMPVGVYATGAVSIHDLAWGDHWDIWFTNTLFSTVCTVEPGLGFRHRWQPRFIGSNPAPVDACHLNGMVVRDDRVLYATALAANAEANGWRPLAPDHGILIDERGEVLCDQLSMPHSPLLLDDKVYFLESGRGRLVAYSGDLNVVCESGAIFRGMAVSQEAFYVGASPVRESSGHVSGLLKARFPAATITRVHAIAQSGAIVASLNLEFMSEISSVHLIPRKKVSFLSPNASQRATTFVYSY